MIRVATSADIPRLIELGEASLRNGPYRDRIKNNPEQAQKLAALLIEGQDKGIVLVAEKDGVIFGLLGLAFFAHYFTNEKTAAEVMWYLLPEYRAEAGFDAIALFRAADRVAREAGCTMLQFTAPTEEIAQMYEKAGLKALEVAYYKDLN